jgi:REP element-mobilizing transposase RayT
MVRDSWLAIPDHFPHTALDAFVIMPNHIHGVIWIVDASNVGARHAVPLPNTVPLPNAVHQSQPEQFGNPIVGSIPTIVRSFKSAATKRINEYRGTPGATVWQRNYYEHIIRTEETLARVRDYILTNPLRWHLDRDNPNCTGKDDAWDSLFGTGRGERPVAPTVRRPPMCTGRDDPGAHAVRPRGNDR